MKSSVIAPRISVLIATRNGLPFLRQNIESLKNQTYKNFELIIQDGDSTDGSIEYLTSIKDSLPFPCSFESASDNGIRQAYGRALKRSRGEILYFTASDEFLPSNGLERAIFHFDQNADAHVYGSVSCVNKSGREIDCIIPPKFDYNRFLRFESSFPMACTFLKRKLVEEVAQDMSFNEPTLAWDFDLWIRVGEKLKAGELAYCPEECFSQILATPVSRSYQGKIWEQFPQDACFMLDRFVRSCSSRQKLFTFSLPYYHSLYVGFALRKMLELEGITPRACELYAKLRGLNFSGHMAPYNAEVLVDVDLKQISVYPGTKQLQRLGFWKVLSNLYTLLERLSLKLKSENSHFRFYQKWREKKKLLNQKLINAGSFFSFLSKRREVKRFLFRSSEFFWGYSVQFDVQNILQPNSQKKRWLKNDLRVFAGAIGICLMKKNLNSELGIREEQTFIPDQKITTYFHLPDDNPVTLIFRNNFTTHCLYEVHQITIVESR